MLMAVTGSIEVCLSLWTADVLRSHAGLSAGGASAAVAAIVCGMFAGRVAGGRVALRWPPVPLLLAALTVSLAGFALFWVAPMGWLAVTGLLVLGLGNALHYPLAISIALAVAGPAADKAAGWASYSMGVGFGIAPVGLGWVADGWGRTWPSCCCPPSSRRPRCSPCGSAAPCAPPTPPTTRPPSRSPPEPRRWVGLIDSVSPTWRLPGRGFRLIDSVSPMWRFPRPPDTATSPIWRRRRLSAPGRA
ncbi:sugar MFS transporter [Micromonospora sp. ATA51]|uniref:MFS transporter n=1 Tax=Micromonospora sp. ATA51 TaxID=2806098 RepID=UPI001EE458BE|nr:hypothetical protein [Micromonospora sp. ATA51]